MRSNAANRRSLRPTALAVLRLLKDCADSAEDWSWITGFVDKLPADVAELEEVRETYAFALANAGQPMDAIAKLDALIALSGPTPERLGLLGGRYKRLFAKAATPADRQMYISKSIDAYERGMELDLNQYYCASNLPRLYKARKRKGDDERARSVSTLVVAACERAKKLGLADEWLRPTLLGAAFDAGDADKAEELAEEVGAEGAALWKLQTTICPISSRASCWSRTRIVATAWRPFSGHSRPQPHKDEPLNRLKPLPATGGCAKRRCTATNRFAVLLPQRNAIR